MHHMQDRQTVLFSATQTQKVKGLAYQSCPYFCVCAIAYCLCVLIRQVVEFANFTFGQNEERQRKLVYVRVDDSKLKVWTASPCCSNCILKFFSLFCMRNNFDALTAYC